MDPNSQKSGRRRNFLRLLIFLGIGGGGAGLVWYFSRPKPVEVVLSAVSSGRVEATVANTRAGTVKGRRRAKLAPPLGGQIARLPVRKGDHVKEGDLLLELWNEDLAAQLKLAESQAAAAKAKADEACLLADQARREARRARELSEGGIASEERVERATADADASEAACKAARAAAQESEARIAVAKAALDKSFLRAPFKGVVAELNAELGEYVTPSPPGIPTPPAVDLIEDGPLYVTAPIDEVDAPKIKPGQTARVTLDAYPGRFFKSRVSRLDAYVREVEKQARTVDVDLELDNPCEIPGLVAGYSADVEILLDSRDGIIRIPTEAVLDGKKVLVYREGRLEERLINTGISNWQYTEVIEGLADGEQIVTSLDREGVRGGAKAIPAAAKSSSERR